MTENISSKILEKIKTKQIAMKPKWYFQLVNYGIIFFSVIFFLSGALASALILELVSQYELSALLERGKLKLFFSAFPYFWLVLLLTFFTLGIAEFLRTRRGYRYRLRDIALVFLFLVILFGGVIYLTGFSNQLESYLEKKWMVYGKLTHNPDSFWQQPEEGLLRGTIIEADSHCKCLHLEDGQKDIWRVDYSAAYIRPRVEIRQGEKIKIIGGKKEEREFRAEEIRPGTKCMGCGMKKGPGMGRINQ